MPEHVDGHGPASPTQAAPVVLAPGLLVARHSALVAESDLPPLPHHAVLVNVGAPYRLEESLGDRWRRTPGAPGDVALVPAGMHMSVRSAGPAPQRVRALSVQIGPDTLAEALRAGGERSDAELLPALGTRSPAVAQLAQLIDDRLDDGSGLGRLSLETLGHALVVAVAAEHSAATGTTGAAAAAGGPRLDDRQLQRVLRHVEENVAAPLRLADLAAVAHTSPFHFARAFRAATGCSPHQYVTRRRTARAHDLLTRTALPLEEIARRSGFADQSHLTRHVKREFGRTPGVLRRSG